MLRFLFATFLNLTSGCGTGWTTQKERDELVQAIKDAGKTGYAKSNPESWKRHLEALNQPQPKDWLSKDGHV